MIGSELRLRVLSAVVLGVLVLALTWAGGIWFRCLAIAMALLIYYEFSTITAKGDSDPTARLIGWLTIAVASAFLFFDWGYHALATVIAGAAVALIPALRHKHGPWVAVAVLYAGIFAVALSGLRGANLFGLFAMIFVFAIVWATDIMAYFCGRAVGGRKLAPRISPGKTWSGAFFGALCGVAAGLAVALLLRPGGTAAVPLIALILSVASQGGDLFESWIKRRFAVKDSSRLIPGHGGVMDRVDGLVFAVFAAFILAAMTPTGRFGESGELAARLLGH